MKNSDLRGIPSVDAILHSPQGIDLIGNFGRNLATSAIRQVLDEVREDVKTGSEIPQIDMIVHQAESISEFWTRPSLMPVINATGIILHTNLGRAPLSDETINAMQRVSQSYNNLEFDLKKGKRGKRSVHAEALLQRLLGIESALVVNNNASAVMLVLSALAKGKKVIIPHSQLVEIGGGFRVPDVMRGSGAKLVAIGTTNRTHIRDYEHALADGAAMVLNAHHSNFKIVGFTTEPTHQEIAAVARAHNCPFIYDQGSGALLDTARFGLNHEPTIYESIKDGIDIICFSGDKLLGGPQAGIIVGKADLLAKIKRHPLARAVRADKTCLAGISATLTHYLTGESLEKIPVWQMIAKKPQMILEKANEIIKQLSAGEVVNGDSMVGGGSLPGETLPTHLVSFAVSKPNKFLKDLRMLPVPIIARIEDNRVLFDPRTILPAQENTFISELLIILGKNK